MRTRGIWLAAASAFVLLSGCATSEEWDTWYSHRTHFASGDHMGFSLSTSDKAPRVTRQQVALARDEGWWGKPVTVDAAQILER